jgi:hypothetical protein
MDLAGKSRSVLRGGSWNNNSRNARAAYRNDNRIDNLNNNRGARLVRVSGDNSLGRDRKLARVLRNNGGAARMR